MRRSTVKNELKDIMVPMTAESSCYSSKALAKNALDTEAYNEKWFKANIGEEVMLELARLKTLSQMNHLNMKLKET